MLARCLYAALDQIGVEILGKLVVRTPDHQREGRQTEPANQADDDVCNPAI